MREKGNMSRVYVRCASQLPLWLAAILLSSASHAACINSLQKEAQDDRFTLQEDVATDTHTGLVWQRCALGQVWENERGRCNLDMQQQRLFTWPQALSAAMANTLGGHNWRLPNKNELASIVERACTGPAINEVVFPSTASAEFWSSTPGRREGGYAWRINFKTGDILNVQTEHTYSIRLVRDAPKYDASKYDAPK